MIIYILESFLNFLKYTQNSRFTELHSVTGRSIIFHKLSTDNIYPLHFIFHWNIIISSYYNESLCVLLVLDGIFCIYPWWNPQLQPLMYCQQNTEEVILE